MPAYAYLKTRSTGEITIGAREQLPEVSGARFLPRIC
jgi:hypothetical protein